MIAVMRLFEEINTLSHAMRTGQIRRVALALVIGTIGALIAYRLHVPLAFMLGALFANMIACFLKAPVEQPRRLRLYCFVVIGLFLSEGFTTEVVASMPGWWPSLLLGMLYPIVIGALCYILYLRLTSMPRVDALFSAIPGGLSGVVMVSGEYGADERRVALSHALRVSMIVVAAPAFFFGVLGYSEPELAPTEADLISSGDAAVLGVIALVGIWIFARLGVPLPHLLAPLVVGAALRASGVVEGALPVLLVEAALIVLGASIGARFTGVKLRDLGQLALWTTVGTAFMVVGTVGFAMMATVTTDAELLPAILAFAPGGVAEMTLISIALGSDPAYVAAHHLTRLGFILIATPLLATKLHWVLGPPIKTEGAGDP